MIQCTIMYIIYTNFFSKKYIYVYIFIIVKYQYRLYTRDIHQLIYYQDLLYITANINNIS